MAQGKLQPFGRTKLVQPLDTGRVVSVKVENGAQVEAGAVLVTLDAAEALADVDASAASLASFRAETLRRAAAAAAWARRLDPPPVVRWPDTIPDEVDRREVHVLEADTAQ